MFNTFNQVSFSIGETRYLLRKVDGKSVVLTDDSHNRFISIKVKKNKEGLLVNEIKRLVPVKKEWYGFLEAG